MKDLWKLPSWWCQIQLRALQIRLATLPILRSSKSGKLLKSVFIFVYTVEAPFDTCSCSSPWAILMRGTRECVNNTCRQSKNTKDKTNGVCNHKPVLYWELREPVNEPFTDASCKFLNVSFKSDISLLNIACIWEKAGRMFLRRGEPDTYSTE